MADSGITARRLRMAMVAAVRTLAVVVSLPVAIAATYGTGVRQETAATVAAPSFFGANTGTRLRVRQETAATVAAPDPAAVEAARRLDPSARRPIQQGLRNEGFDPGPPDGLFGPRTRAAIRRWQDARRTPSTDYLDNTAAQLLREAAAPPAPPSLTAASVTDSYQSPVVTTQPRSSPPPGAPLPPEVSRDQATSPAAEPLPPAPAAGTARLPPEILVDRHLLRAEQLLADNEPAAAFEAMSEVLALHEEQDLELENGLHFQYARVAFAAGRTETAIASLKEYLIAAGRDGESTERPSSCSTPRK